MPAGCRQPRSGAAGGRRAEGVEVASATGGSGRSAILRIRYTSRNPFFRIGKVTRVQNCAEPKDDERGPWRAGTALASMKGESKHQATTASTVRLPYVIRE